MKLILRNSFFFLKESQNIWLPGKVYEMCVKMPFLEKLKITLTS